MEHPVVGDIGSNALPSSPHSFNLELHNQIIKKVHMIPRNKNVSAKNPYNSQDLSGAYSSTSTILNVRYIFSFNEAQGQYYGWVQEGMTLRGQTSGAIAKVANVRLISDISATLIGSYYIPDPNNISFPRFETGTKTLFTLTDDIDNNQDQSVTIAEGRICFSGTLETVQENIISVRNARVEQNQEQFQSRNVNRSWNRRLLNSTVICSKNKNSNRVGTRFHPPPPPRWGGGRSSYHNHLLVEDNYRSIS